MKPNRSVITFIFLGLLAGCGVKGKPLPPLEPAEIGRGVPTYKRTAEQAKPESKPEPSATPRRSEK